MKWHAVLFDFDGVIVDSVDLKTDAFAQMFKKYGKDIEKKVVDYHIYHGGISRYEKFKYFYKVLLNTSITEKELNTLGQTFSKIVTNKVIKAPLIDGAEETLEYLKNINTPAFVVTGTPQNEIDIIVEKRKLSKYFKQVYGSPLSKTEIIMKIKKINNFDLKKSLLVGDSITDYNAAVKTQTNFLGVVKINQDSPFPINTKTVSKLCITNF